MATIQATAQPDEVEGARRDLYAALEVRDAARERYEAAIGTSTEFGAYSRLRAAAERVSALDASLASLEERSSFTNSIIRSLNV